jgi:hypothetical protein
MVLDVYIYCRMETIHVEQANRHFWDKYSDNMRVIITMTTQLFEVNITYFFMANEVYVSVHYLYQ